MEVRFHHLSLSDRSTIDVHTDQYFLYLLTDNHEIQIYTADTKNPEFIRTISLSNHKHKPVIVYVDDETLLIGYDNGTTEIRLVHEEYDLLRVTSKDDPSGPGSARITGILASNRYLLVKAHENGLLIYSKPSLLFYKWIMIGGHTVIKSAAIRHQILYVLTEDNEVHLLNFDHHRIYEQEIMSYQYVDIEFNGTYLFAATSTAILVYLTVNEDNPVKPKLVAQLNFEETISGLIILNQYLLIILNIHLLPMNLVVGDLYNPNFSFDDKIEIPNQKFYQKLKYNYFTTQHTTVEMNPYLISWLDKDDIKLMTINY